MTTNVGGFSASNNQPTNRPSLGGFSTGPSGPIVYAPGCDIPEATLEDITTNFIESGVSSASYESIQDRYTEGITVVNGDAALNVSPPSRSDKVVSRHGLTAMPSAPELRCFVAGNNDDLTAAVKSAVEAAKSEGNNVLWAEVLDSKQSAAAAALLANGFVAFGTASPSRTNPGDSLVLYVRA